MIAEACAKDAKKSTTNGERNSHGGVIVIPDATDGGRIKEKDKNMKTLVRIMAVVAMAGAFVLNVNADNGAKTPKGKGPVIVAGENAIMTCPKCKNDYAVKVTRPPKGTEPEKAVIATHLCEKCNTKLVVKGEGKAKTDVAVHTCNGCK